jgi:hypothetical protein
MDDDAFLDAFEHGRPQQFPRLLDGRLLDAHYSPELLATAASRNRPVAPDRLPLPATAR